jgi:hypothetical protein
MDLFKTPMQMTAEISDCKLYRPELRRIWDKSKPILTVCMLNPSDADDKKNDPTVRELIYFATLWGDGGIIIVNLFDFRASSPKEMMAHAAPLSAENTVFIDGALNLARHQDKPLLAAWGAGGSHLERDAWFIARARHHMVDLVCLGLTKDGFPKHPMARGVHRIPRNQQPILFRSAMEVRG